MPPARFDILDIGNAIVDVVARAGKDFLSRHTMHKGTMALVDAATEHARADVALAALTRSEAGSLIQRGAGDSVPPVREIAVRRRHIIPGEIIKASQWFIGVLSESRRGSR